MASDSEPLATTMDATQFDHLDPAMWPQIHKTLRTLRRACPVRSERHGGFWVVTTADHIREIANSPIASAYVTLGASDVVAGQAPAQAPLFERDGLDHREWRKLINPFLMRPTAANWKPHIRALTRTLLAELEPKGRCDFVRELADRIPAAIIAAIIGVPANQRPELGGLARRFVSAHTPEEAGNAQAEYARFMTDQIRNRSDHLGDDLLSTVVQTKITDRDATDEELVKFTILMTAAGYFTTADTIATALLLLTQDRGLRQRLIADSALIPAFVEEVVRFEPAVAATGRTLLADTTLGTVPLSAGDRVLLVWGSGNRDEKAIPDGDVFRLDRGPTRHLGWGAGPHRCPGRHLARVEVETVIEAVLDVMPDFELDPDCDPRQTFGVLRGVDELRVTWPLNQGRRRAVRRRGQSRRLATHRDAGTGSRRGWPDP